jgi:catechol 2,3-dioxygenase-like lactoylglutathione lyase family enzyme
MVGEMARARNCSRPSPRSPVDDTHSQMAFQSPDAGRHVGVLVRPAHAAQARSGYQLRRLRRLRGAELRRYLAPAGHRGRPDVVFQPPADADRVSHAITVRVADCQAAYEALRSKGATFLTPPHDWGAEIRCFLRDPDGHLVEISQLNAT